MKNFKKFAAAVAATLMAASMVAPMAMNSFAAELAAGEKGATITINSSTNASTHSNMAAYQIFTGTVTGTEVEISGWGDGINVSDFITAIKADTTIGSSFEDISYDSTKPSESAVAVAKVIGAWANESAQANAFAKLAVQNCSSATTGTFIAAVEADEEAGTDASTAKITGVPNGYYVVIDEEAAEKGDYSSYTLGLLKVVGEDIEVTAKVDFPSFDKLIGDVNDTVGGNTTFNEAGDWDMGDAVPFQLKATIPSNFATYDTYKMIFHDDIDNNVFDLIKDDTDELAYTVKYYANASATPVDVTSSFTYAAGTGTFVSGTKGNNTEDFTLTCADIKAIDVNGEITGVQMVTAGGYFLVEYSATLTENAYLGATGNWNSAYLEYSNNPNVSGNGENDNETENSPVDSVVAFTYQTVINKVDQDNNPLTGAMFTLYKEVAEGTAGAALGNTFTKDDETTSCGLDATKYYVKVTTKSVNDTDTETAGDQSTAFNFEGLDDGTYVLVETTVPNSYNPMANVTFDIVAVEKQTDGEEALESLTGTDKNTNTETKCTFETGKVYTLNEDNSAYENAANAANNASLSATVMNKFGTALPSTGGIGTTLFYLGGGAIVAVAGVFLITKKRMKKEEL